MNSNINSANIYKLMQRMLLFVYKECQKRTESDMTESVLAVAGAVEQLMDDPQFHGDSMKMAMMLISFGRIYELLGGQENIILREAADEDIQ